MYISKYSESHTTISEDMPECWSTKDS